MHVLTVVADPEHFKLCGTLVARVRRALGAGPADWLSPDEAVDLPCAAAPDPATLRDALDGAPVDAIATPAQGRRKRLLVADMDSTIVTSETLDEIAARAGVGEAVAAITRRSMNGEIDFATALRERVAMLRGYPVALLDAVWQATTLSPGAAELVATMRAHGATTALVSGGFTYFTSRVAARASFDRHHANDLLVDGAHLAGTVAEPVLGREAKLAILTSLAAELGLTLDQTLAVGDGANDLAMVTAAGLGVAYHAKPIVAEAARARVNHCGLRALLFAQGYRAGEIQPG